jgi:hypothetical protein
VATEKPAPQTKPTKETLEVVSEIVKILEPFSPEDKRRILATVCVWFKIELEAVMRGQWRE